MADVPRHYAVRILNVADAFLIIQALDRGLLAEVVLVMVTISICGGESQVVVV